jgi:hypothetical protein
MCDLVMSGLIILGAMVCSQRVCVCVCARARVCVCVRARAFVGGCGDEWLLDPSALCFVS